MQQKPTATGELQWKGSDAMDRAYAPSEEIQVIPLTAHQEIIPMFQPNMTNPPHSFWRYFSSQHFLLPTAFISVFDHQEYLSIDFP